MKKKNFLNLHTVGVAGSKPAARTILFYGQNSKMPYESWPILDFSFCGFDIGSFGAWRERQTAPRKVCPTNFEVQSNCQFFHNFFLIIFAYFDFNRASRQ